MPATGDAKAHGGHHRAGPLNRFRKGSTELIADVMKAPAAAAGAALRSLGMKPHDQVPKFLLQPGNNPWQLAVC